MPVQSLHHLLTLAALLLGLAAFAPSAAAHGGHAHAWQRAGDAHAPASADRERDERASSVPASSPSSGSEQSASSPLPCPGGPDGQCCCRRVAAGLNVFTLALAPPPLALALVPRRTMHVLLPLPATPPSASARLTDAAPRAPPHVLSES